MRFLILLCGLVSSLAAAVPAELAEALKIFRSEPPKGWSYTQTTRGEGKSTVERYNAAKPEFDRWTLVQKDGRAPTADELRSYAEGRSRRSRTGTAPSIVEQLDLSTLEVVNESAERGVYRCRLRRGETRDKTAAHLRATVTLHRPTKSIEVIELSNDATFSPTIGVKITELKTLMTYTRADGDLPSLPRTVETRVRGSAFFFKSLDAELSVTFSEYAPAQKR